ncbi:DNA repair protein RecN [Chitinilyticum piscinae]|uniref:DNA repair protein RecN n=1 Tax=Chitinilyticum piscinae TaxID=2866724 RepID=A0A8J7FKN0_9NEIS|nr:DNA repair protein RecN [Chitinilyticum piscinae]MBE9609492.1 DNA repair protein RecN [Chitinilyticum piscinae]
MLHSLHLRDFVIVRELELSFSAGLTVLTGETGAGKSILIDALGLLLGERADAGLVRQGAERAELNAVFTPDAQPGIAAWLEAEALQGDDGQLLLRRVIDSSGKSRAWINGTPVTLAQLKSLGELLVDIHGQHAHQSLLRADAQRALLDDYAQAAALAREVRDAYRHWQGLLGELQEAERNQSAYEAECERLQWQIDELAALNLAEGEWPELQTEHKRLHHAASLIEGVQSGLNVLADGDENCQSWLASVQHQLAGLADYDAGINETLGLLEGAEAQLADAVHALRHYADRLELDPARLSEVEARLDAVFRMARKFRLPPEDLPRQLQDWQARLSELGGTGGLEGLQARVAAAENAFRDCATQLSQQRAAAAIALETAVNAQLPELALGSSRFAITLLPLDTPAVYGLEQVELQVANHPSAPLRALAKVASGGELSRISLALQVVTSRLAAVPTLIFDEVDVGIGGKVAEIVGRRLRELGEARQVLCITHLPQVAACGHQHLQVSKTSDAGGVVSAITELKQAERIDEIARMLGGVTITETTRQHAEEMLGIAG